MNKPAFAAVTACCLVLLLFFAFLLYAGMSLGLQEVLEPLYFLSFLLALFAIAYGAGTVRGRIKGKRRDKE